MNFIKKYAIYLIFVISLSATLISLYFSSVLGWAPCVLCWYQRIFLYPIVIVSAAGILYRDRNIYKYILPLSIVGMLTALLHNLLYWGIISESVIPCKDGVSCTVDYLELAGFITIPLLSFLAFVLFIVLSLIYKKNENK